MSPVVTGVSPRAAGQHALAPSHTNTHIHTERTVSPARNYTFARNEIEERRQRQGAHGVTHARAHPRATNRESDKERDSSTCPLLNEFQVAVMKHYNNKNVPYVFVMVATSGRTTMRLQRSGVAAADRCAALANVVLGHLVMVRARPRPRQIVIGPRPYDARTHMRWRARRTSRT